MTVHLHPDGPFSLAAAGAFGFGPNTGRPTPVEATMRMAFVTDDLRHQAGVLVGEESDGTITVAVESDAPETEVGAQVARILSLDGSATAWLEVGRRDPAVGRLQRRHRGLRPVLFHSPYEAAAWSVISARRHRSQAAALRTRMSMASGRTFMVGDEQVHAFPTPERLLEVDAFPGLDAVRIDRLHVVARAALEGRLDAERLRAQDPTEALAELQQLPGIGPMYATLILLRSTGATDVMTYHEPRLASYVAHYYGLDHAVAGRPELEAISARWAPFRTWTAVLLRVAGEADGLPWAPPDPRARRHPAAAAGRPAG